MTPARGHLSGGWRCPCGRALVVIAEGGDEPCWSAWQCGRGHRWFGYARESLPEWRRIGPMTTLVHHNQLLNARKKPA